jgi:hypothetical protein
MSLEDIITTQTVVYHISNISKLLLECADYSEDYKRELSEMSGRLYEIEKLMIEEGHSEFERYKKLVGES